MCKKIKRFIGMAIGMGIVIGALACAPPPDPTLTPVVTQSSPSLSVDSEFVGPLQTRQVNIIPLATTKVVPPMAVPSAQVGGLRTTGSTTTTIGLSWDAVPNATSYLIKYGTSPSGLLLSQTTVPGTTLTLTGRTPATVYYFTVEAMSAALADGPASLRIAGQTDPTQVTILQVLSATNTTIQIVWEAVPKATSYNIRWGTTSGDLDSLGTSTYPAFAISSLTSGTRHFFTVEAVLNSIAGAVSAEGSAEAGSPMPESATFSSDLFPNTRGSSFEFVPQPIDFGDHTTEWGKAKVYN